MSSFLRLKLQYPLGSEGYACLVMGAASGKTTAHYAYADRRRGREAEAPEYICISPTFDSRDGEYRHRFIRWEVFVREYESQDGPPHALRGSLDSLLPPREARA